MPWLDFMVCRVSWIEKINRQILRWTWLVFDAPEMAHHSLCSTGCAQTDDLIRVNTGRPRRVCIRSVAYGYYEDNVSCYSKASDSHRIQAMYGSQFVGSKGLEFFSHQAEQTCSKVNSMTQSLSALPQTWYGRARWYSVWSMYLYI